MKNTIASKIMITTFIASLFTANAFGLSFEQKKLLAECKYEIETAIEVVTYIENNMDKPDFWYKEHKNLDRAAGNSNGYYIWGFSNTETVVDSLFLIEKQILNLERNVSYRVGASCRRLDPDYDRTIPSDAIGKEMLEKKMGDRLHKLQLKLTDFILNLRVKFDEKMMKEKKELMNSFSIK